METTTTDVSLSQAPRDLVARYWTLRHVHRELNGRLMKLVPKADLLACAKQLGFWDRGRLVFDDDDQMALMWDVCVHDCWRGGRNAVARYVAHAQIETGSDESVVLGAMQKGRFSIFAVDKVHRGVGVGLRDLILGDELSVIDSGLGNTAHEGIGLLGRILTFDGWAMTSGAAIAVGNGVVGELMTQALRNLVDGDLAALAGPDAGEKRLRTRRARCSHGRPCSRSVLCARTLVFCLTRSTRRNHESVPGFLSLSVGADSGRGGGGL